MLWLSTPAAVDQRRRRIEPRRSRPREPDVAVHIDRQSLRGSAVAAGSRSTAAAAAHAPTANGAGDADQDENERDTGGARRGNDDDGHRKWTSDTRRRTTVLLERQVSPVTKRDFKTTTIVFRWPRLAESVMWWSGWRPSVCPYVCLSRRDTYRDSSGGIMRRGQCTFRLNNMDDRHTRLLYSCMDNISCFYFGKWIMLTITGDDDYDDDEDDYVIIIVIIIIIKIKHFWGEQCQQSQLILQLLLWNILRNCSTR